MTKRKQAGDRPYSPLQRRLFVFRQMALNLASTRLKAEHKGGLVLTEDQRIFLVDALWRIGSGEDATEVLGTKAKRGERRSVGEAVKATGRRSQFRLWPLRYGRKKMAASGFRWTMPL